MRTLLFLAAVVSIPTVACNRVPVETPSDFAFVFKSQFVGVYTLNTFNDTFRRITASTGDTTISFRLTKTQLDSLYTFMRGIDFFSLPEYLEPELSVEIFPSPWYTFNVRTNGIMKRVRFGGSFTQGVKATQDLQRLSELIIRMIMNSQEYEGLPQATAAFAQGTKLTITNSH